MRVARLFASWSNAWRRPEFVERRQDPVELALNVWLWNKIEEGVKGARHGTGRRMGRASGSGAGSPRRKRRKMAAAAAERRRGI